LKEIRFLQLKNPKNPTGSHEARLEELKRLDLPTGKADGREPSF
jgi:hypothetical protein